MSSLAAAASKALPSIDKSLNYIPSNKGGRVSRQNQKRHDKKGDFQNKKNIRDFNKKQNKDQSLQQVVVSNGTSRIKNCYWCAFSYFAHPFLLDFVY
jgi:hypothetical protein